MPSYDLPGKPVSASRVNLAQLMQPEHANALGDVHGGWVMKLVDEAGALACMRHAQHRVVTVAVDSMSFRKPVKVGDLVMLTAEVTFVGRTSMEAEVVVHTENPVSGERIWTNTAYLVYVALDENGKPIPVPPVIATNDEERRKLEEGRERQARRLAEKK